MEGGVERPIGVNEMEEVLLQFGLISLGSEIGNCNPPEEDKAASGTVVVGLLVVCKSEAGVLSGEAGLEGLSKGEEF